jgi:hypothetical protein
MTAIEYYQARREQGLCVRCPNVSLTHTRCMACRLRQSELSKAKRKAAKDQG